MKVITMYLPQYHRIKENDEWWGEGFTDWIAVKSAEKLYDLHKQPRIPLDDNYYDLMDYKVMRWQSELMKKYGIDGQCIYHYWFKDGRQILEKPAENLLRWKDIHMPFCFCWANETWARSWSKINNSNKWAETFEKKDDSGEKGILLHQQYGSERQWREHFEYLIPFFGDERYLKKDNKPIFMIYKTSDIDCLADMLYCWRRWAKENGLDGLYVIGANSNYVTEDLLDSVIYHEPQCAVGVVCPTASDLDGFRKCRYEEVWEEIIRREDFRQNVIYGGFVGYDDTPRRGRKGLVVENQSPEAFEKYLTALVQKNEEAGQDLLFINAWNEWGEGMYLEPDRDDGMAYLEAVSRVKRQSIKALSTKSNYKEYTSKVSMAKKMLRYKAYWSILDKWLAIKENNLKLSEYFVKREIQKIAIYGLGMLGKHLYNELKNSDVEVCYGIDQKGDQIQMDPKIFTIQESLPKVDAVIVTVLPLDGELYSILREKEIGMIISIQQIIEEF